MFRFLQKRNRLNNEQAKAEREAVRLLKMAQEMLLKDPRNAEEAKRIRYEVTHKILPPHRMYIIGKHPQSLLRDVDKKINYAYMRQVLETGELYQDEAPVVQAAETREACEWWHNRYGMVKNNVQRQIYWSFAVFLVLLTTLIVLMVALDGGNGGGHSFSQSFSWLSR